MKQSGWLRAGTVVAVCAVAGAGAGIAGSAAAPSKKQQRNGTNHQGGPGDGDHGGRFGGPGGPPVHAEAVVLNKAGDGFITLTEDSGTVVSVSGDQLTVKEGFGSVTYKTVTLTIPASATVKRNFADAKLSDLKAGDRVHVASSSEGTIVFADDGTVRPPFGPHGDGDGPHGGPPGAPYGAPGTSGTSAAPGTND